MKLAEKVAYLKGLADGLKLDSNKAEVKMINGIVEVLDEIASVMDVNTGDILEMTERVDEIDMDLGDLEAFLFEGLDIEELTEEDLEDLGEEDAFAVVYTTDEAPDDEVENVEDLFVEAPVEEVVEEAPVEEVVEEVVEEEEELDDEAIFAAADEVVAEAEAAEAAVEEAVEEVVEEPEETIFEEVAAPAAAAAAATADIAWPDEEPVEEIVEEPAEVVEEVVEREAEPDEEAYEVECPTCGHVMLIDDSVLAKGSMDCPKCNEHLEFDIEYED